MKGRYDEKCRKEDIRSSKREENAKLRSYRLKEASDNKWTFFVDSPFHTFLILSFHS